MFSGPLLIKLLGILPQDLELEISSQIYVIFELCESSEVWRAYW